MKIQRLIGAMLFMGGAISFAFGSPHFIPLAAFGLLLFIEAVVIIGRSEWNIRKHGYPPIHCDADGDLKRTK